MQLKQMNGVVVASAADQVTILVNAMIQEITVLEITIQVAPAVIAQAQVIHRLRITQDVLAIQYHLLRPITQVDRAILFLLLTRNHRIQVISM